MLLVFMCLSSFCSYAGEDKHDETWRSRVLVTLGDSYSSGEGVEPFYGQEEEFKNKVVNPDWLAHRSRGAWAGYLELDGLDGILLDHKDENWVFVAASGATTKNITQKFTKEYNRGGYSGSYDLPAQRDAFSMFDKDQIDYVTITIGGNDVHFADIVANCVLDKYCIFGHNHLSNQLKESWDEYNKYVKDDLYNTYKLIAKLAGNRARILVVGYPPLFYTQGYDPFSKEYRESLKKRSSKDSDEDSDDCFINKYDAYTINENVKVFNYEINKLVEQCSKEGMNIEFVSVSVSVYEGFEGREAYSRFPYINEIIFGMKPEDLTAIRLTSAYSVHPNGWGIIEYSDKVQRAITNYDYSKECQRTLHFSKTYYGSEQTEGKKDVQQPDICKIQDTFENTFYVKDKSIVLTLDTSKSMKGDPLDEMKKASLNFVDNALSDTLNIGVVSYDGGSYILSDLTSNKKYLDEGIQNLKIHGSTDISGGLSNAYEMLRQTDSKNKIIILMGDGEPTHGLLGNDLISYAKEIKDSGVKIYVLGFFKHSENSSEAQELMRSIASEGCYYNISNVDDIVYTFDDVADTIEGQNYINININCPVDVRVEYNGEVLDSSAKSLSTRTSFGTLAIENEKDSDSTRKTLRLKDSVDYNISITGTGQGLMNYTIGFADEEGEYTDVRTFEDVRIIRGTKIDTVASSDLDEIVLNIDNDGDGKYDLKLKSKDDISVEVIDIDKENLKIFVLIGLSLVLFFSVVIIVLHTKRKVEE